MVKRLIENVLELMGHELETFHFGIQERMWQSQETITCFIRSIKNSSTSVKVKYNSKTCINTSLKHHQAA